MNIGNYNCGVCTSSDLQQLFTGLPIRINANLFKKKNLFKWPKQLIATRFPCFGRILAHVIYLNWVEYVSNKFPKVIVLSMLPSAVTFYLYN